MISVSHLNKSFEGGRGGLGNAHFKTAINQAVEINEPATDTEARLRLLRKYYYVPENTTSCEEVEKFVRHYVAEARLRRGECDK